MDPLAMRFTQVTVGVQLEEPGPYPLHTLLHNSGTIGPMALKFVCGQESIN